MLNIIVDFSLHVLWPATLQGAFGQNPCFVNQQVETYCIHQGDLLLGVLFYATKVSGVWQRKKESGASGAVNSEQSDKYQNSGLVVEAGPVCSLVCAEYNRRTSDDQA